MTLTRKQIEAKQAATPEGWRYDWKYAVIHGEHTCTRCIELDAENYIEARLMYREEMLNRWQRTGQQIPTMHVSLWHRKTESGYASSFGLGEWADIGEARKDKNYKALCKIADSIFEDDILKIYNQQREKLQSARVL